MTVRQKLVRRSRLGIACFVFVSAASPMASAQQANMSVPGDSSLLHVQKSLIQPDVVGDLFPDPVTNPTVPNPAPNPTNPTVPGTGTGTPTTPNCGFIGCDSSTGTPWGSGTWNGNNWGTGYNGGYTSPYYGTYDPRRMDRGMVAPDFQCNLFENTPMSQVLSSLNALNAVVVGPACDGKVTLKSVVDDNTQIANVIKNYKAYLDNPELVTPQEAANIGNQVDIAIQSASNLATTFANTAAFSKKCRDGMNAGQIATSLNSVINGLTPYALMASSLTGGTAAVPFIMGGAVLTGAINSISTIIDQNTVNIGDQLVRQAVVENTCQYIRLEQKYRFLTQSRKDQIKRINDELTLSESMFSAKLKTVSPEANSLIMRRNAIDQTAKEINNALSETATQFQSDKIFFDTADLMTACNFGVAVAKTTEDKTSYAAVMLASLDQAMAVYGKNSGVKAATLKSNATMAIQNLKALGAKETRSEEETKSCAATAKYLVKTVEDSATVSKQLLKLAKSNIDTELQKTKDYGLFKASIGAIDQKKIQAGRVVDALEAVRTAADAVTRSEIDNSMNKIRQSLFSRSKMVFKSPVLKWFEYTEGLHNAAVRNFSLGLDSLRLKATSLTPGGKNARPETKSMFTASAEVSKDRDDGYMLKTFTLKNVPLDTPIHTDVCRELRGVFDQWRSAVTHLGAMAAFCGLIEPYVLDAREEDKEIVAICRSDKREVKPANGPAPSHIMALRNKLIEERKKDWAMYLNRKIDELVCLDPTTGQK